MNNDSFPKVPDAPSDADTEASGPTTSQEGSSWASPPKPSFNSPAADLNQLRNEAKRVAESAPSQPVHRAVLDRARRLAANLEHDLGLPESPDGLCYADLAVLLAQSR